MPATTTEIYCPVYDSAALHYSGPVSDGLGYNGQLTAEASDLSPQPALYDPNRRFVAVRSANTGDVLRYEISHRHTDREGELTHVTYRPKQFHGRQPLTHREAAAYPSLVIFND
jgi:hypothetical protein